MIFNFEIRFYNPIKIILIPSLISVIVFLIFTLGFNKHLGGYDIPLFYSIFSSLLIAPFFEELLFRGVILGGFLYAYERSSNTFWKAFTLISGLGLSILGFVWAHQRMGAFPNLLLFVNASILSLLFIFYKKNLVPSIIAHFFFNFLVILSNII